MPLTQLRKYKHAGQNSCCTQINKNIFFKLFLTILVAKLQLIKSYSLSGSRYLLRRIMAIEYNLERKRSAWNILCRRVFQTIYKIKLLLLRVYNYTDIFELTLSQTFIIQLIVYS